MPSAVVDDGFGEEEAEVVAESSVDGMEGRDLQDHQIARAGMVVYAGDAAADVAVVVVAAVLLQSMYVAGAAGEDEIGEDGCSPGHWAVDYDPLLRFGSKFTVR